MTDVPYHYASGRRKTAVARVFLLSDKAPAFTVNGRPLEVFFPRLRSQLVAKQALLASGVGESCCLRVTVKGGGEGGQAEAVRHGIARALVARDETLRPILRAAGYISRDARAVERKKAGLRKARRSRQYSKR